MTAGVTKKADAKKKNLRITYLSDVLSRKAEKGVPYDVAIVYKKRGKNGQAGSRQALKGP